MFQPVCPVAPPAVPLSFSRPRRQLDLAGDLTARGLASGPRSLGSEPRPILRIIARLSGYLFRRKLLTPPEAGGITLELARTAPCAWPATRRPAWPPSLVRSRPARSTMATDQSAHLRDGTAALLDVAQAAGSSLQLQDILDCVVERANRYR